MRMHPVPALIAFLGGLAIFGISGMILGRAIVAMSAAVLDLWRERSSAAGSAMSDATQKFVLEGAAPLATCPLFGAKGTVALAYRDNPAISHGR